MLFVFEVYLMMDEFLLEDKKSCYIVKVCIIFFKYVINQKKLGFLFKCLFMYIFYVSYYVIFNMKYIRKWSVM